LNYTADFTIAVEGESSGTPLRRTTSYTLIAQGRDRSLVLMREPRQFYPGTLLIVDGAYWLLFPRSDRPLQLTARHMLDGDIANGDLTRGNLLARYDPRLDGSETIDGDECWILELTRRDARALHPRVRVWVARRDLRPVRFDYYGETGQRLKTARYEDYRRGDLGFRSHRMVVDSTSGRRERTTLTFTDLRRIDPGHLPFDQRQLASVRDAARQFEETHGRQVRAEELAALFAKSGS
jgi:hypothetical protein